jgi:nucleolar protein 12
MHEIRPEKSDQAIGSELQVTFSTIQTDSFNFNSVDVTDEAVWQHFASCGEIESVRIIRDNKTGIGKGFGYVQFKTADTVGLALRLDGSQMAERKIRVSRAVKKLKEKKAEALKKQPVEAKKASNKFQSVADKRGASTSRRGDQKPEAGLSKLGKPKHQKRKEERAAGIGKAAKAKAAESRAGKSEERIPKRKRNEMARKKLKKRHVATNKKGATRFNL